MVKKTNHIVEAKEAGKMRVNQRQSTQNKQSVLGTSIFIIKIATFYKDKRIRTPYEVMGIWALTGIVIGQAKKPGPSVTLCIINLTHAWNNRELLRHLKEDDVFGHEHSMPQSEMHKVR